MNALQTLFPTQPRVIERLDDLNHPCGFDVVMTIPATAAEPEHDEYICSLPDRLSPQQRQMAELIAAIPKMLDLLADQSDRSVAHVPFVQTEESTPFNI